MKGGRDLCWWLLVVASCLLLVGYFISPTFLFLPEEIDVGPAVLKVRVKRVADLNYPPTFFGKVEAKRGELAWQSAQIKIPHLTSPLVQEGGKFLPSAKQGGDEEGGKVEVGTKLLLSCKQLSPGRAGVVWCRSPKILSVAPPPLWRQKLNRLAEKVGELWQTALPGPAGGFAEALLTGNERRLGPAVRDDFRRTGLQHVLALSGYNVTVLVVWLGWLLGALGLSRRSRLSAVILFLFVYTIMTGASPSLVRASLFGGLALLSRESGLLIRPWRLVWLTLLATLWLDPLQLWSVSFLLSYSAFVGIVCLAPALEKFIPSWIVPTISASLTTFPVLVLTFGQWSWMSLPANLLLAPLWPLTLFMAWSGSVMLWLTSAGWWLGLWRFVLQGTLGMVSLMGLAPSPLVDVPNWGWPLAAIWYSGLVWFISRYASCQRRKMC